MTLSHVLIAFLVNHVVGAAVCVALDEWTRGEFRRWVRSAPAPSFAAFAVVQGWLVVLIVAFLFRKTTTGAIDP